MVTLFPRKKVLADGFCRRPGRMHLPLLGGEDALPTQIRQADELHADAQYPIPYLFRAAFLLGSCPGPFPGIAEPGVSAGYGEGAVAVATRRHRRAAASDEVVTLV